MENKRLLIILSIIVLLLFIPLIAMLFTDEVNWTMFDFIVAAILLFSTSFAIEIVLRKVKSLNYRIVLIVVFLVMFLLIWAELAIGVFGTPFGGT